MPDEQGASKASAKVRRQRRACRRRACAANASPAQGRGRRARYFDAIAARDLDDAVALWAPGGRENVRGQVDVTAPDGVRAFLGELIDAFPDLDMQVISTTTRG